MRGVGDRVPERLAEEVLVVPRELLEASGMYIRERGILHAHFRDDGRKIEEGTLRRALQSLVVLWRTAAR